MTTYLNYDKPGPKTTATSTGETTTTNKSADLSLIRSTVSDVLNSKAKGTEYTADASAQRTSAAGYDAEIASYGSSERISNLYAAYSKAAGDIYSIQAKQDTLNAVGGQRAALANSGFSDSADIVRSSLQRGYLQDQLVRTQSLYDQAGYLEQASAASAESAAAGVAKNSTLDTAAIYDTASEQSKALSTNLTSGLSDYLSKFNTTTTAEGLVSGTDIGTDIATSPKVVDTSTNQTSTSATSQPKIITGPGYNSDGTWNDAGTALPEPKAGVVFNASTGGWSTPVTTTKVI